jgi:hypothetical protein
MENNKKTAFAQILKIAQQNVEKNPSITSANTESVITRYLTALINEVEEVRQEAKGQNEIRLMDELSDIAWDYATLLSVLADRHFIGSVDEVLEHACKKYSERAPAFLEENSDMWDMIKDNQKTELEKKHREKYGE